MFYPHLRDKHIHKMLKRGLFWTRVSPGPHGVGRCSSYYAAAIRPSLLRSTMDYPGRKGNQPAEWKSLGDTFRSRSRTDEGPGLRALPGASARAVEIGCFRLPAKLVQQESRQVGPASAFTMRSFLAGSASSASDATGSCFRHMAGFSDSSLALSQPCDFQLTLTHLTYPPPDHRVHHSVRPSQTNAAVLDAPAWAVGHHDPIGCSFIPSCPSSTLAQFSRSPQPRAPENPPRIPSPSQPIHLPRQGSREPCHSLNLLFV